MSFRWLFLLLLPALLVQEPSVEERAIEQATTLLQNKPAIADFEKAEKVLLEGLRQHYAQRERPLKGVTPWAEAETRLLDTLRSVRRQWLATLIEQATAPAEKARVLKQAEKWLMQYPQAEGFMEPTARLHASVGQAAFSQGNYADARDELTWLELHHRPEAGPLRDTLRGHAQALFKEAEVLSSTKESSVKFMEALAVYPALPGLRDAYLKKINRYTILYVGVRSLPEFLSPALACTDSEKQAEELIFEGLIRSSSDAQDRSSHHPQLAQGPPLPTATGQRLALDVSATWSNGEPVRDADVRHTVELLKSPTLRGRSPEWTELWHEPALEREGRIEFRSRQSLLDPLAGLDFKILPSSVGKQALTGADDEAFARQPVGSGPYVYRGRKQEEGRLCAVFTANPHYQRDGRTDLPFIREIRFYVPLNPLQDLNNAKTPLHLWLDVPTARLTSLTKAGVKGVQSLPNRRVYFLAANHRVAALADQNLRRALAHGIDRERLLRDHFRGSDPNLRKLAALGGIVGFAAQQADRRVSAHHLLNGPFPAGSWACAPSERVPKEPLDLERARVFAKAASAKLGPTTLTLKYPDDDPRVAEACRDLVEQVKALGWSLQIQLMALPPHKLREAIDQRDYQLAYCHHDFASNAYWLWPLFNPAAEALSPGGGNFLGYVEDDADLERRLREVMGLRSFPEVKRRMQDIHAHLYERMPLIPLWQLDTHLVIHPTLQPTRLDPLTIFDDVAHWNLRLP